METQCLAKNKKGERNMGLGISGFDEELDDCLTVNARKISEIESSCLLKLTGYIDTYNSAFFQKKTDMLLNAGYSNFILDCSDLNYISSTGIGSLASFLRNQHQMSIFRLGIS